MTDDIEWYPLPEVDDSREGVFLPAPSARSARDLHTDTDSAATSSISVSASRSSTAPSLTYLTPPSSVATSSISVSASRSSTAPSLTYLTPPSSVGNLRLCNQPNSHPHVTGTVQPRCPHKKQSVSGANHAAQKNSTIDSSTSVLSAASGSREKRELLVRKETLSLVGKSSSSSAGFKTAKSVPLLKFTSSCYQTTTHSSESSRPAVSSSRGGISGPSDTQHPPLTTSTAGYGASNGSEGQISPASSGETALQLPPNTTTEPLDTSVLTVTTPPTSPRDPPSEPTLPPPPPGVLPAGQQQPTIPPDKLNHLWTEFLAGYLSHDTPDMTHRQHSRGFAGGSEMRDTGIQTTPSLAFSIPLHQTPSHHTPSLHTPSLELESSPSPSAGGEYHEGPTTTTRLSQLTLQEALRTLRPEFVRRSEQRQRELLRNRGLCAHIETAVGSSRHGQPTTRDGGRSSLHTPHFVLSEY